MTPSAAMQNALEQVEQATGYSVTVQTDSSLTVLATAKSANADIPFTLIRLLPGMTTTREDAGCYPCEFVLRQAALPQDEKWDVTDAYRGRKEVDRLVSKGPTGNLPSTARATRRFHSQRVDCLQSSYFDPAGH